MRPGFYQKEDGTEYCINDSRFFKVSLLGTFHGSARKLKAEATIIYIRIINQNGYLRSFLKE